DASGTIANLALGTITSGTVPFTCDANTDGTARSATVTLTYTYNSTETVTKDVTITQAAAPVIYNTIPALFAAATGTATNVNVAFDDWIVTGVSTNGKNVFITDGTNGFAIYNSGGNLGETYAVGNILSGTTTASLKLQNGYAQLTDVVATNLTITSGGSVAFANIPMADLAGVNTGALVHYDNLTCSVTSGKYYLSDGTTTLQVYNSLYAFGALEAGKIYNISGVYQQYNTTSNTTKEVLPRSAADIEEVVVSTPAITLDTYQIDATAAGANGTINATYTMIEIAAGLDILWYESDGVTTATYNWILADFDTDNNIEYIIDANDGAARSAYFKVYGIDAGTNDVYSNLVTINQDAYAVTTYTVTYAANGGTGTMTDPNSPYLAGVEVTLLANAFTAPEGMKWDSWEVKDADNQDVTVNGGKFTMPASNVTVTAQWVVDPDAPQYEWVLTDIADLTSSDIFVIVGNNGDYYAMTNDNGTSSAPATSAVTVANNKLSSAPADNLKWNIGGNATDGYIFYPNGDSEKWLYCTDANNGLRVGTNSNKSFAYEEVTTTNKEGYYLTITPSADKRYVCIYNSSDWRSYKVGSIVKTNTTFFKRQIASTDPVLYTDDVDIASDATAGEITYTLEHPVSGGVLTAAITAGNEGNWLTLGTVSTTVPFTCSANTVTTARTATITLTYTYNTNVTLTATAVVTQAAHIVDYATLPFAFDGGKNDIENTNGLTQEGLDSDYGSSPKLKFNTTGDWVILKLNEAPTSLSYTLKGNGTSYDGGTFSVQTSADGVDYVDLAEYVTTTLNNKTFTYTHIDLNANVRYVKWIYTNKSNGNVALGDIHATANYDIYGTVTVASLSVPATKTCTIYEGGQLIHDTGTIPVTMVKHVKGYTSEKDNYYLITVPFNDVVDPTTVTGMTTGNFDLYEFHAWEPGQEWANFEAQNSFDVLQPGVGYLYAKDTDIDLEFTGTINPSTDYEYYMGFNNDPTAPFDGWEIVGNPFACNTYITGASTTGEGMAFYRMNTDGNGFTAATGAIKPLEGVFVQATADNQSFTFTRTAPVTSFGHGNLNLSLAQVVTNRGEQPDTDNAIIRFDGGSTLEKYSFRENTAKLYITQNGKDYSVVNSEAQGEMPVNFKAANDGTYTLDFSMDNVEFDYLHLIDNKTGMDIDLLQTPSYTFEATTHDYAARFRLVFSANSVNENSSESFAFISNGQLILTNVDNNTTVQMIDALGRMIVSTNAMNHVSTDNMAPGVYVLRLVNGNDVKTQKIVVK
ncbi:MAG: T9SS type A sorting domain-containing protein, partial [Bacteroidales bacterium]|nr:T9SS type A sorting domain-containing protein [Bacteroidales bacterium]